MKAHTFDWLLALAGGLLLALLINYNSVMALHSTPLFASWLTHGVGLGVAIFLMIAFKRKPNTDEQKEKYPVAPFWSYFGGIPGAMTIVLAAIVVNSSIGLAGSIAFMLVGQIIFGLAVDFFGLFGTRKRCLRLTDIFIVLSTLAGSLIIIFFRP